MSQFTYRLRIDPTLSASSIPPTHTTIYSPVTLTEDQQNWVAEKAREARGNAGEFHWSHRTPDGKGVDVFSYAV